MTQKTKVIEDGDVYTITVPTKTEKVPKLDKDKKPILDEDGEEILETKVLESIECKIKINFKVLKGAYGKLVTLDKQGNPKLNLADAGEHLLMYGTWLEGDEEIKTKTTYKLSACMALANIVSEFPVSDLKKN